MMKIPVVIVDDEDADRYIARRKLARSGDFEPVYEAATGYDFLKRFFSGKNVPEASDGPLVVLMDVNMPRMNGFETIEEVERQMVAGRGPDAIEILMYTSSDDPKDRARAGELAVVKGYIVKPLDDKGVDKIRDLCTA